MNKKCWACKEREATTGEHLIKKSDLDYIYSEVTFLKEKNDRLKKTFDGQKKSYTIESTEAEWLKYEKNLCEPCNTSFTKPHDKAYEKLIPHVDTNCDKILRNKIIDLRLIHPNETKKNQSNMFRFLAKNLGCVINSLGHEVPNDIVNIVNNRSYNNSLMVTFSIFADQAKINKRIKGTFIRNGETDGLSEALSRKVVGYHWYQIFGWFQISYWYNLPVDVGYGEPWIGKNKMIRLGNKSIQDGKVTFTQPLKNI